MQVEPAGGLVNRRVGPLVGDDERAAKVGERALELDGAARRIERGTDGGRGDPEEGERRLVAVRENGGDAVAATDPRRSQGSADASDVGAQLGVGDGRLTGCAERNPVGYARRRGREQLRQRHRSGLTHTATMPDETHDVVVTCTRHAETPQLYPQVLGYYLAKHLVRAGVRAAFRHLPLAGLECEVLICSEYQAPIEWFERHLAGPLGEIQAARMFCVADYPLGFEEHWSSDYCRWFGRRGGVLCLLAGNEPAPYEHRIGVGVDTDVVAGFGLGRRQNVVFDVPFGPAREASDQLEDKLAAVRNGVPGVRLVGTGPAESPARASLRRLGRARSAA